MLYSFIVHRLTWLPAVTAKKEDGKMTKSLRQSHRSALRSLKNTRKVSPKGLEESCLTSKILAS